MWRMATAGTLTAIWAVAVLSTQTSPAHACTPPDSSFDAYALNSLIIEGRILGWGIQPEYADSQYPPIVLDMDIERVWKGEGGRSIRIEVHDTLQWFRGEASWGPGGLCGIFHEDPTGSHIIFGLREDDSGSYRASSFSVFFRGDGPEGESYDAAVSYLESRQSGIILPSTGSGPSHASSNHFTVGVATLGVTLLAASGALGYRSRRNT